ncbi:phospho-N-acetylmuramoyl-pentapeptide-transferase [bacterium]|jgi:phospho-N-acetylmuramoyl-pentapeptide-transferase|nr:phospho-N-acetylmuramoyl-pentapeptide-transferase [bacterium]MDP6571646.1 phospho-N-acetylmuramoyl-pentapeptide-transferase [Patescibacteria group bacterium]MDP6756163.1 phospho-N-acetylmuramoyl-pentapeptide-transferase [Patescibacteria group bacterium]|tara:strand:- start:58158 stop:59213 length:1056 start_codon:yes stop_codon:yes gene_type:complete
MDYISLFPVIKIFILTSLAFAAAIGLTPVLSHFLYKYKLGKSIRDKARAPIFARLHSKKAGTPTMGGILIWMSVLVIILVFFYVEKIYPESRLAGFNFLDRGETLLPLGALVASSLIGLADDWLNIRGKGIFKGGFSVWHRLIVYTVIAIVGSLWFFYKLDWDLIHVPFVGNFEIGLWYIPIFIFIIVATSFSVNNTDGLDGLAGGLLIAAFASFGAMAFVVGRFELATFCGVIVGALLAFLWFNIAPARFFMGDTGSMGLGVTLGIVAMLTNTALFLPVICFLFVLESGSVIVQQLSKKICKKKVFLSTPIHHHFEAIGWSEPKIVMRFWVISGVTAVLGFILFLIDSSL